MGDNTGKLLDSLKGWNLLTDNRIRQRGVTIIEVMIAIAIVAVLLMQGVPSFRTWLQNAGIRTAAESILNGLQLARAEAVKNNALVAFTLGTGSAWTVGCVVTDRDGDGNVDCPAIIQDRPASDGTSKATISLSEVDSTGAEVGASAFVGRVAFNGSGRVVTGTSNLSPSTNGTYKVAMGNTSDTCVSAGGTMRCLRIIVTPGGQIRMCDPAFSQSTNPMGC